MGLEEVLKAKAEDPDIAHFSIGISGDIYTVCEREEWRENAIRTRFETLEEMIQEVISEYEEVEEDEEDLL